MKTSEKTVISNAHGAEVVITRDSGGVHFGMKHSALTLSVPGEHSRGMYVDDDQLDLLILELAKAKQWIKKNRDEII